MVSVRDLTHSFGDRVVLRDINLEVAPGEIVAIMGSSGGGKTTLLRCISGLIRPTQGSIEVDSIDVLQHPDEARRHMGMVFQSAALFDYMDVEENVTFGIRRQLKLGLKDSLKIAGEALERVGLEPADAKKMPAELSGGMRKRVGMARALALKPNLMLYDEPTTGLDPITTHAIDSLIVSLRKDLNMTSMIVSHDVISVLRTSDRIAFLHDGEIVFEGKPSEFMHDKNPAIRELVEKSQASTLA